MGNLDKFFGALHQAFFGGPSSQGMHFAALVGQTLTHVWLWVIYLGYIISAIALFAIVYILVRLFDLRRREEEFYEEVIAAPGGTTQKNPRWQHIQTLAGGASPSEWREAIIEADIFLNDILARQGYQGASVGEKLREVNRADFHTLNDAWEAHKVRNQIAHEGSAFSLSETLARRTIAHYEAVFREFDAV